MHAATILMAMKESQRRRFIEEQNKLNQNLNQTPNPNQNTNPNPNPNLSLMFNNFCDKISKHKFNFDENKYIEQLMDLQ
jgi:hypothetical protein